jgi:S-adenosyl methyltransferase
MTGQDMGWTDEEDPYGIVARYEKLMPSGSYLLLTHFSNPSPEARGLEQVLLRTLGRGQLRSREQITRFFDGLDLVEPGIVHLPDWHPDEPVSRPLDISGLLYLGGLARKP